MTGWAFAAWAIAGAYALGVIMARTRRAHRRGTHRARRRRRDEDTSFLLAWREETPPRPDAWTTVKMLEIETCRRDGHARSSGEPEPGPRRVPGRTFKAITAADR